MTTEGNIVDLEVPSADGVSRARARLIDVEGEEDGAVVVDLIDGDRAVLVPRQELRRQDGQYCLSRPLDAYSAVVPEWDDAREASASTGSARQQWRVPLAAERIDIEKRQKPGRRVRVETTVERHTQAVDEPLERQTVSVERVPVNRPIADADQARVRQEDGVTVIPVLAERLVVKKELVVAEEVRVTRQQQTVRDEREVELRSERAQVTELDEETTAAKPHGSARHPSAPHGRSPGDDVGVGD